MFLRRLELLAKDSTDLVYLLQKEEFRMPRDSLRRNAKEHLERARKLLKESSLARHPLTEEELIAKIRQTREKLWEEKLASRP